MLSAPLAGPSISWARAGFDTTTHSMLWAGQGRLALGLRVEQHLRSPAGVAHDSGSGAVGNGLLIGFARCRTGQVNAGCCWHFHFVAVTPMRYCAVARWCVWNSAARPVWHSRQRVAAWARA